MARRNALNHSRPRRGELIWGSVTSDELLRIKEAYRQAGFENVSQGGRVINLAFTESAEVRDAVAKWYQANMEQVA